MSGLGASQKGKSLVEEISTPFARFGGRRPRGVKKVKLKRSQGMQLIYDCYAGKILADEVDDRDGVRWRSKHACFRCAKLTSACNDQQNARQSLPDYFRDNLLNKYGLPSLTDGYLFSLVAMVTKQAATKLRLKTFGRLTGVLGPEQYSERACDVYLALLKRMCPKFGSTTMRSRPYDPCPRHSQFRSASLCSQRVVLFALLTARAHSM